MITPSDKAVLDYANTLGEFNILHCCGWAGDRNNIEVWQDYEAAAVNWAVYVEKDGHARGPRFLPLNVVPCSAGWTIRRPACCTRHGRRAQGGDPPPVPQRPAAAASSSATARSSPTRRTSASASRPNR